MRVLMLSKALVVAAYRRKLAELANTGRVELLALTPASWHDGARRAVFEPGNDDQFVRIAPLAFADRYHLHFYPTLRRVLAEFRPDLVHVDEEPYNFATFHATALARRFDARVVFFTWQNLDRRYPPPFRWFERYVYARSAHAIAGSEGARAVLRGKGYTGPVAVIPQFGVDPEAFSPRPSPLAPRSSLFALRSAIRDRPAAIRDPRSPAPSPHHLITSSPHLVVGYVGRLVPEKGLLALLDAFAQLDAGSRLRLIGSGPLEPELRSRAAALGIADRVELVAAVPSARIPQLLRQLDVLVLPSLTRPNWKEQFGRALVEAMAAGVPVVGSDSGEIPHVIGDAGIVVPEGQADALGQALRELARCADRRAELGQRGRARVLAHYTHAAIAAATLAVYRAALT